MTELSQRLTTSLQPVLVQANDCAFDIVPGKGTVRVTDVGMNSKGLIVPIIELRRNGVKPETIIFDQGFLHQTQFHSEAARRDFQESAIVWFEEGEPGGALCIMVCYGDERLEHWLSYARLQPFMKYLNDYPPGSHPDFWECMHEPENAFN